MIKDNPKKIKLCSFKVIEPIGLQSEVYVKDKFFTKILLELPDWLNKGKIILEAKGEVHGVFSIIKNIKKIEIDLDNKKIFFKATKDFVVEETY